MIKIEDIKEGVFIKKEASIYLVKDFKKEGKGYKLVYFFRSTAKPTGVLHFNDSREFYEHELQRIKVPTIEEVNVLKNKIFKEHPTFHFDISTVESNQNLDSFTEKSCIEFLRERGYLVFKQV